jgi:hypothetical protein
MVEPDECPEDRVSLPITARQMNALRALQRNHPDLGELAASIALAFDASMLENPELARTILEVTCRRIVSGEPFARTALIDHLERFREMGCLSLEQVNQFSEQVRKLG